MVVGLLGAGLMVGCSPPEQPWAARAEDFFAAFHEAQGTGVTNAALFYAEDVDVDMRSESGWRYTGRAARVQAMRDSWLASADPDSLGVTAEEPIYLSVDGAVDPARLDMPEYPVHFSTAYVYSVSDRGITAQMFAASNLVGEYFRVLEPDHDWGDKYLSIWSAGDPSAVQALYADGAVVRDSMTGVLLEGRSAIAGAAQGPVSGGALTGAVRHTIADEGGPAAYGNYHKDREVQLLTVDDGSGCPGEVAVALWLEGEAGLIVREERYHRVDALRRCTDPSDLPTGWWDAVTVADPAGVTRTGMLDVHIEQVAVWNGTPELERLLSWGLGRFADAVLPAPTPASVTFLPPQGDPEARYGFVHGGSTTDIAVLVTPDQACPDGKCEEWPTPVKAAVLHQLAHVWLAENVPLGSADEFARERGMVWSDPGLPWAERASERAAETLTWGLMDEPYDVDTRLGALSCQALAADLQDLTGAFPDPSSCAGPAAAQAGR